jgi:RNA polymerase sigma-70 factor (ECF subfamily)
MTNAFRRRARAVVELVDEPPGGGATLRAELSVVPLVPAAPESFETFYRREYPRILVLARALGGAAVAEDLAQEVMLTAYRSWTRIAGLHSPAGYVRGICVHQAASVTRRLIAERRALQKYAARPAARLEPLPAESEDFWAEVRRLPRRQAQSAALYYALDLSVAEIAQTLGCAEGTVKAHLSRARTTLSERFADAEELS